MPVSQTQSGEGPFRKAVANEDLQEVGYKRQVSLNGVIARAKGLLMDMSDNVSRLREVRIILFSNSDNVVFHRTTGTDIIAFEETTEQVKASKCSDCDPDVSVPHCPHARTRSIADPFLITVAVMILFLNARWNAWSSRHSHVMRFVFTLPTVPLSLPHKLPLTREHSPKLHRRMCCKTFHRLCHLARDAWMKVIPSFGQLDACHEANHILCPGCLEETPRCISMCINCSGTLISHGTLKKIKAESEKEQKGKSVPKAWGTQASKWKLKNLMILFQMFRQMMPHQ